MLRKTKPIWLISTLFFALILVAAWMIGPGAKSPPPLKLTPILTPPAFSDGTELQVFAIEVEEWETGDFSPPPPSPWYQFFRPSYGSSFRSVEVYGGRGAEGFDSEVFQIDDEITGIRYSIPGNGFMLLATLKNPNGTPIPESKLYEKKFKIEIMDGEGEWLAGQFHFHEEDPFDIGLITFRKWPETSENLQFRMSLEGNSTEFVLPNPLPSMSEEISPPLPPEPLEVYPPLRGD